MTTFWVAAITLLIAVVALLAVPLVRRRDESVGLDQDRSNVVLYHDQLRELERDHNQGLLSDEQFEQARVELSQRLLIDVDAPDTSVAQSEPATRIGPWRFAALACVPIATVFTYLVLGSPQAVDPSFVRAQSEGPSGQSPNLEEMAARLAERVQTHPDDTEAWVLLARSYQLLGRAPEAVKAFARAIELVPGSPQLLADYVDVQLAANKGEWTAQALEALKKSLEIDPNHPKSMWLAGTEAYSRKDYPTTLSYWEKLLPLTEPGSEVAQIIQNSIAEIRSLMVAAKPSASVPPQVAGNGAPVATPPVAAQGALSGRVTLDPKLQAQVQSTDTVFVFARAVQGPKMPLAIRRITAKDLPYAFTLDDTAAMAPEMVVSKFDQVVVGARVSRSGSATPTPGDLEGFSPPVKPGAVGIEVRIDARVE